MSSENFITLIAKDEKMKVNSGFTAFSDLIRGIIEDSATEEIPIEMVTKQTLTLIISYAEHYNFRPPMINLSLPLSSNASSFLDAFQLNFLKEQTEETFQALVSAASYLQMKHFLQVLLAYYATTVKEKSVDELRMMYYIADPLTEDVEEDLMKEFSWVYYLSLNK